jgi:hypothetical protein
MDQPKITIVVERNPVLIWADLWDPNETETDELYSLALQVNSLADKIVSEIRRSFKREVNERGFDAAVAMLREFVSDRALLEDVSIEIEEREPPSDEEVAALQDALVKLGETLDEKLRAGGVDPERIPHTIRK